MNLRLTFIATLVLLLGTGLLAQGTDIVIQDLEAPTNYNAIGGFDALSMGFVSCNQGTSPADWNGATSAHPVFTQNLYRLSNGRFEQVGMSWARHAFLAVPDGGCGSCLNASPGNTLPGGCRDRLSATLAATQTSLGPRSEIDPTTGVFPFPATNIGTTGDSTFKRLRVATADLDAVAHPNARYFVEGVVVSADDASSDNRGNNRSWREIAVSGGPNNYNFNLMPGAPTIEGDAVLQAWRAADATVQLFPLDSPGDGRFIVGFRGELLPNGSYLYEFAVANLDSRRGAKALRVFTPGGAQISAQEFHDVDYHSGESFDGSDWSATAVPGMVSWSTSDFASDPNANALRWGTLYNFRFISDTVPVSQNVDIEIDLFAPGDAGDPTTLTASIPPITFLTIVSGDDQSGNSGELFPNELTVLASDTVGQAVAGISIDFTQVSGSPMIFPQGTTAITDANGIASLPVEGSIGSGAVVIEANSLVASAPVSFDLFVRRLTRNWIPLAGVLVLQLQSDLPNQAITIAVDDASVPPTTTPFGDLCTSILNPGPSFYAESGFSDGNALFNPALMTTTLGSYSLVRTGLNSLAGSGLAVNHQVYSYRFVNGELDVFISNCITATY
jgi:hypothetical protein